MSTYDVKGKILIIKPPHHYMPIGLAYVLGCLEREGIPFDFVDLFRFPKTNLKDILLKDNYFAIATGGLVGDFRYIHQIILFCKNIRPGIPFILGGGITRDLSSDLLFSRLPIDYAVLGEAETSLPHLLYVISEGVYDRLDDCNGVLFRSPDGNEIVRKSPLRLDLDKDDPLPAYRHIDVNSYMTLWNHYTYGKMRAMPVLTGRGCKGRCSFCSPTLGRFHARKIEYIIREIQEYYDLYHPDIFEFLTEIMFETEEKMAEFCKEYKKLPFSTPWVGCLRVDIDPEILYVMKDAGCICVNIGIESGSDRILQMMKKRTTIEEVTRFIRTAREVGIFLDAAAMLANEGESIAELRATMDIFINEDILRPAIQLPVAYPGTLIYKNAVKRGLIQDEWEHLNKVIFGIGPKDPDVCKKYYVNISDIPNDMFWPAVYQEYRRYMNHLYRRCSAVNMSKELDPESESISITGHCPECHKLLRVNGKYSENFLNMVEKCPDCKIDVYFNPFDFEETREHALSLNRLLREADRLVIYGTNENAYALFIYSVLDIPFDRVMGFVDPEGKKNSDLYFYFPRLTVEDMYELNPDIILKVDSPRSPVPLPAKGALQNPRVVSLAPAEWIAQNQEQGYEASMEHDDTLYAFYDLGISPATFDVVAFLVLAELERKKKGCASLHVAIVPGHVEGFRDGDLMAYQKRGAVDCNNDYMRWRLKNIVIPCCWLISSCQQITVCASRKEAESLKTLLAKHIFPDGYALSSPIERYSPIYTMTAASHEPFFPSICATPQARRFAENWILTNLGDRKLITISLRECAYEHDRNSSLEDWGAFVRSLDMSVYCPVIIRDIETSFYPLPEIFNGAISFKEAVWNLELRAALYELSYLNMFVGNGPDAMCCYNRKTRFIKLRTSASSLGGASEQYLKSCAMRSGTQLKWATPFQRLAWEDDKLEVLQRIFEEMCNKIDRFTSSGIEDLIATFNAAIKENNLNNAEWVSSLAVEQFPENSQAWLIRSKALQLTNQLEDAISAAKQAVLLKNH